MGCFFEEDKDLIDDVFIILVNILSDIINGRLDIKKYFKSRFFKFESDSDIEIVEIKFSLILKFVDDFYIFLLDFSSDDLFEVLFFKEEKVIVL